jgi:hypothetical protein
MYIMSKKILSLGISFLFASLVLLNSCKPEDTIAPALTLIGGNNVYQFLPAAKNTAPAFVDPDWKAIDNRDGDMHNKVKVYGTVNTNLKGTYMLTYSVKDAAGNVSTVTRTINIINNADSLAGSYTVTDTAMTSPPLISSYASSISSDMYVNNMVHFGNFGGYYGDSMIVGYLNASKTAISIPSDTARAIGAGNQEHVFSGGGTDSVGALIPTIIKLNWTDQSITPSAPTVQHNTLWKH